MTDPERWAKLVDAVVGGADPRARRAFALDRLADPSFERDILALERVLEPMAALGGEAEPLPGVWDRVEAALDAEARVAEYATNIRVEDEGWEPRAPGVFRRRLWDDRTYLARVEPGCSFPPHDHPEVEHCLVLAGSMHVDGLVFGPGDYHAPQAGSRHGTLSTPEGLLLLLRCGD
jgi:hypothetical protein